MVTQKEFEGLIYSKYGDEYIVKSDYAGQNTKVTFKHKVCGKLTDRTPKAAYKTKRGICQYCYEGVHKGHQWFLTRVAELTEGDYEVLSTYTRAKDPITIRHKKCSYEWETTPDNFLRRSSRCPSCANNARMDTDSFHERLYNTFNGEYTSGDEYVNARTKMRITHETCGNSWEIAPDTILNQKVGCPNCSESKGERYIRNLLEDLGISYTPQKTFPDCRNVRLLPYDFYLDDYNVCVEFDGIQHYEPTRFGGMSQTRAEEIFKVRLDTDNYKTEYCKEKRIELLRIPYYYSEEEIAIAVRSKAEALTPKGESMI